MMLVMLSRQHMTYKASKLGQTGLVFGCECDLSLGPIRRSAHARLQLSLYV